MKTEREQGSSKADLKPTGYRNTVGRATFLYQSNARLGGTSFPAWWSGITTNHRQPHCLLPPCLAANSLIRIPHKYRHCAQAKRQHKTGKAIRFKSSPAYSPRAFFFPSSKMLLWCSNKCDSRLAQCEAGMKCRSVGAIQPPDDISNS